MDRFENLLPATSAPGNGEARKYSPRIKAMLALSRASLERVGKGNGRVVSFEGPTYASYDGKSFPQADDDDQELRPSWLRKQAWEFNSPQGNGELCDENEERDGATDDGYTCHTFVTAEDARAHGVACAELLPPLGPPKRTHRRLIDGHYDFEGVGTG